MGGYCTSASSVASEEPKLRLSQLSYTDKLLIREKRVREVPKLTLSQSAIYQRREITRGNRDLIGGSEEIRGERREEDDKSEF